MATITPAIEFLRKHERPLGAALFVSGFITDILTFNLLPLRAIVMLFGAYAVLGAVACFGTHALARFTQMGTPLLRTLSALSPLALLYAAGGILSGLIVFYTSHSVLIVSWPFIALLALVYFGNEYFRKHKEHLIFQTILFFFCLYAYAVFALPVYVNALGPFVFLGSSAFAILVFLVFLRLLWRGNHTRLSESLKPILASAAVIVVLVNAAYFTGIIPPVPLALVDSGVYHSVVRTGAGYTVRGEAPRPWFDPRPPVVHHVPGTPVYAWSAISAPVALHTDVMHVWEYQAPGSNDWVTRSRIYFPVAGGRPQGYRVYSEESNPEAGNWRVTVKTADGAAIGRIRFDVEGADTMPALTTKTL